jgi:hypothetical protein
MVNEKGFLNFDNNIGLQPGFLSFGYSPQLILYNSNPKRVFLFYSYFLLGRSSGALRPEKSAYLGNLLKIKEMR